MKRFACSIVGLGRIASSLEDDPLREKPATHAGAISSNPECTLLSGCDPDPEKRRLFAERWGCASVFATIDELLANGKPDILHVASPPDSHAYYVFRAIRSGIPLVICEKPLSESIREAKRIAYAALRSGTVLMVNHERRYSGDYIRAKRVIAEKTYGRLLSVSARLAMGYGRKVSDMLFEDGTHMADIIMFLTDTEIRIARSFGRPDEKGGNLLVVGSTGPVRVTIEASCDRDHLVFELVLGFERGRVVVGNGIYEEYGSEESAFYKGFRSLVKKIGFMEGETGYFSGMLADAVRVLKEDGNRKPVSGGLDGYLAVKTIHDIISRSRALVSYTK